MKKSNLFLGAIVVFGSVAAYYYFKNNKKPITSIPTKPAVAVANTASPIVATTNVPTTAVNSGSALPVIMPNGTLSGSTAASNSDLQTINANYNVNLNKANIAFEELKLLRSGLASSLANAVVGQCAQRAFNTCQRVYTESDRTVIRNYYNKKIRAKETEIFNLGFKVVGDKLFLI